MKASTLCVSEPVWQPVTMASARAPVAVADKLCFLRHTP